MNEDIKQQLNDLRQAQEVKMEIIEAMARSLHEIARELKEIRVCQFGDVPE